MAVEFIKPDSDAGRKIHRVLLKEVDKPRYTMTAVLDQIKEHGYLKFKKHQHDQLVRNLDAKNPSHRYGKNGDHKNTWVWNDKWVEAVLTHCKQNGDRYS